MVDNVILNPGTGGDTVAADDIAGIKYQRIKTGFGEEGVYADVSLTDPLPVSDLIAAELLDGMQTLLIRLLNATNSPRGYDVALGRNRMTAILESGTVTTVNTVTTTTTVGTVSNQTNMGGQQAQLLTNGQNVSAWAATVRSRIT
jgi:hypothetical protein